MTSLEGGSVGLTREQLEFFAVNGYVTLKGVVDPELLRPAQDAVWERMLGGMTRDPATWNAKVCDCRGHLDLSDRFGLVKLRSNVRSSEVLNQISIRNPRLLGVARHLLGAQRIAEPVGFRGVYPIFPTPHLAKTQVSAHIDVTANPFKLTFSQYLADIPTGGGALTVWPGSHRLIHFACATNASNQTDFETEEFRSVFWQLNQQPPLELPGNAGDVVVMHYRLLHAASINEVPDHVRLALYFNLSSNDAEFSSGKPSDNLWDGWEGIDELDSECVQSTRARAAPISAKGSPLRRNLASTGAWAGFAQELLRSEQYG
jgi:hypothetical protein